MSDLPPNPADAARAAIAHPVRIGDLNARKPYRFDLRPTAPALSALAGDLGLSALKKLRFTGDLTPLGARDWQLQAHLGATVVQPCVVTLDPVTTRIEEDVRRQYLAAYTDVAASADAGDEIEMPEDDTIEALPATLDLGAVMVEALALALPHWPRAPGVDLGAISVTEPGREPLRDADMRPFAMLREQLDRKRSGDPD